MSESSSRNFLWFQRNRATVRLVRTKVLVSALEGAD
jgi:hypothetical protein